MSPAGLWIGSREPCKFYFHFNDGSLVVTLAQCWKFTVLPRIQDKSYSTLNFRCSGTHLWTSQYLIHQQLFSFMASLGAGRTGVNKQCSICACSLPSLYVVAFSHFVMSLQLRLSNITWYLYVPVIFCEGSFAKRLAQEFPMWQVIISIIVMMLWISQQCRN